MRDETRKRLRRWGDSFFQLLGLFIGCFFVGSMVAAMTNETVGLVVGILLGLAILNKPKDPNTHE